MQSNKVEYSTSSGMYCTAHDIKAIFYARVSRSKIINHCFHINNHKGESGIGYDMIICKGLMVQLGLTDDFKHKLLQWDGATLNIK